MPDSSAICDIVTESSPCWDTSAAVVSRTASRTWRRCASSLALAVAGLVLLVYMQSLGSLAAVALDAASTTDLPLSGGSSPVLHTVGAVLLLLVATVLGLYKPRGVTRYGWRKQQERRGVVMAQT